MRNQSASFFKTKSKVLLIQTKPARNQMKVPFFPNKRPWPIFTRHSSYPLQIFIPALWGCAQTQSVDPAATTLTQHQTPGGTMNLSLISG